MLESRLESEGDGFIVCWIV